MKRPLGPLLVGALGPLITGLPGCGDSGMQPHPPEPWRCVVDGRCEGVEDGANCPEDCDTVCPADFEDLGPEQVFVIQELFVPRDTETAAEIGADLDGDGTIDNKWGTVYRIVDNLLELRGVSTDAVARGELAMIVRLRGAFTLEGARVALQLLPEAGRWDVLHFDGTDVVTLDGTRLRETEPAWACGRVQDGSFYAGPSGWPMTFPLVLTNETPLVVDVPIRRVTIRGRLEGSLLTLTVGGGIDRLTLRARAPDPTAAQANAVVAEDPLGRGATDVLGWFDGNCEPTLPGCDPPPADCVRDGHVSAAEVACDALTWAALHADVRPGGRGAQELLSIGYRATLVPATLVIE